MLALVAGAGRLPVLLADRLEAEGRDWRLCVLEGVTSEAAEDREATPVRLERLGSFLDELREAGVTEVCFAGAVNRPHLDPSQVEPRSVPLIERLALAMQAGDDTTLRAVLAIFEEAGLTVRAAHELRPDLLPAAGVLSRAEPDDRARSDAARAADVVATLGAADVGQGCVVAQGQVLAVEALAGTDWMLASLTRFPAERRPDPRAGRGLLYKGPKPGQDRRVDLPAIGPGTVRAAAEAGLGGVVVEAGGVVVLDPDATVAAADEAGLFLWVRAP